MSPVVIPGISLDDVMGHNYNCSSGRAVFQGDTTTRRGRMAASQQLDRVIEMMKARSAGRSETVEDDRVSYERFTYDFPLVEGTRCERVGVGNVAAEWVTAPGADENRIMLYFHGGGYLFGSTRTHRATLSRISQHRAGESWVWTTVWHPSSLSPRRLRTLSLPTVGFCLTAQTRLKSLWAGTPRAAA